MWLIDDNEVKGLNVYLICTRVHIGCIQMHLPLGMQAAAIKSKSMLKGACVSH